jgi:folate-binding protein YgfZ
MKNCIPVQLDELVHTTVRGADADAFLQGQLSNDLRLLTDSRAQLGSYNSAKGRMLAVIQLRRRGDDIVLELHRDIAAATCKRLRMFVLRAKVVIADDDGVGAFGLVGADAAAQLAELGLPAPQAPLELAHDESRGLSVLRRLGATPRYSVHAPLAAMATLLDAVGPLQCFDHWRRADIDAGVPTVYAATADHFIPQTANLDLLGGISFDKGCYTGQEIVARLHYLGEVKRRLFGLRAPGPAPAPGDEIRSVDGAAAGEVVDAVSDGDGCRISAIVQLAHANAALQLADGRVLEVVTRPPA